MHREQISDINDEIDELISKSRTHDELIHQNIEDIKTNKKNIDNNYKALRWNVDILHDNSRDNSVKIRELDKKLDRTTQYGRDTRRFLLSINGSCTTRFNIRYVNELYAEVEKILLEIGRLNEYIYKPTKIKVVIDSLTQTKIYNSTTKSLQLDLLGEKYNIKLDKVRAELERFEKMRANIIKTGEDSINKLNKSLSEYIKQLEDKGRKNVGKSQNVQLILAYINDINQKTNEIIVKFRAIDDLVSKEIKYVAAEIESDLEELGIK